MTGNGSTSAVDGIDVTGLRLGGLFAGSGALELAVGSVLRTRPMWFLENDPAAAAVLMHHWPDVPNLGDITQVDWGTVEPVDVFTGGFPCTDLSGAGRRAGLRPGTRSGLWSHMAYAISQLHPKLVIIENVRGLLSTDAYCDLEPCSWCVGDNEGRPLRALGRVLGDLADLGFDARWCGVRASDVGAPHSRFRVFIAAWPAAENSDGAAGGQRGTAGSGQAPGWRPRPDFGERGSVPAADPGSAGLRPGSGLGRSAGTAVERNGASLIADANGCGCDGGSQTSRRGAVGRVAAERDCVAADAEGDGLDEGRPGSAGQLRRPHAALSGDGATDWGIYGPAIWRWESVLGRPAPSPTLTGQRGGQQLSPHFVEWLMGWPEGWVTAVPGLSRNDQLKICGNGVVPHQAAAALRWLLA